MHLLPSRALAAAAAISLLAACSGAGGGAMFTPGGAASTAGLTAPSVGPDASWHDLGRAGASTAVHLAVVLKYRNEAKLDQLVIDQADPSSGSYHHFLTSQEFARQFGPTQKAYADTMAALRQDGFTIEHTFANRTVIDASAPAPTAERVFSTEIHLVRRADGSVRYRNVRPETIPPELAGTVLAAVGLDSAHTLHPDYVFNPKHGQLSKRLARPAAGKPLLGPDGGYGPRVYHISYAFPQATKLNGKGRASAVVGDADFLDTDLAQYLAYFQVKRIGPATTRVLVDGGPPPGLSQDSVETTLDVETLVSIAPGTALYVYEAPSASDLHYFTDMYNQVVSDNKVDTVNTSYSECETAFVPTFPKAADAIFKQGAALGITFHSSTGDYGTITYGCSSEVSVGSPADTPHNVAIGGTIEDVNHTTGQETSEVGWNDGSGATGGGVSIVFKLPQFQKNVANVITSGRNIPDVSFDASPYTGESLYYDGRFDGPIGGTSLSSPLFGAGLTILDQKHHSRAGFFNTTLYKKWKNKGYGSGSVLYFRDITSGSIPPYQAKTGYDQMSGIGAMLFANFGQLFR